MRRINTLNKDTDAFGAGKHGWKNGVPGTGNRPTEGQAEWFNALQEEVARTIEAAGIALDGSSYSQLQAAIQHFAGPGNPSAIRSLPDVNVTTGATAADNLAALNAALATKRSRLLVPEGEFNVSGSFSNVFGAELEPGGRIVKPITGGKQLLNSYADLHKYVFGQEYLAAFHKVLMEQMGATGTRAPIGVFSGDSTTAGDAVDAPYQIHSLARRYGLVKGLNTPFGLNFINAGHSGWNTERWRLEALAGDLALNPDVYVLRWGINDPGYYSADYTTGPALDAGQAAPGRRTAADYLSSLRTALATIRAARSVASLSIVLMTPNSTSDTPNARDELWYEQIVPGIKQAARDFNCCFVDTYAWLRDSRPAAGVWMDNPLPGGGRAIHPLNVMNTWIAGLLGQVLFPEGLATSVGRTSIISVGGAEDIGDVNRVPSYYGYGLTISRAGDGSGFPFNGILQTVRAHDEVVMQYCYSFTIVDGSRFAYRVGRAVALGGNPAGWEAWVTFGATQLGLVTASAGYAQPVNGALRVAKAGAVNTIEGYISKSAPAVIAANTQIGTIPAGFRPTR